MFKNRVKENANHSRVTPLKCTNIHKLRIVKINMEDLLTIIVVAEHVSPHLITLQQHKIKVFEKNIANSTEQI